MASIKIKSLNARKKGLDQERQPFIPIYQSLSDYHLAHRGRFLADKSSPNFSLINQINNTSRLANRTLASGMMAGITSPARPWFRLGGGDPRLEGITGVKDWLHQVQQIMYHVFATSNTYNSLHQVYTEIGVFGIAAMGVFKDFDSVIRCKPYTVGSYMIGTDGNGRVDTFYREYSITVAQLIKRFGIDNVSDSVRDQWKRGNSEQAVRLTHAIEPNDDRDMISPLARDMKFRSIYYEESARKNGTDSFLLRSGFEEFPILTPRWDVVDEDAYATDCPGMTALGDTKALQLGERRGYQALDKMVNPKLMGPVSMENTVNMNDDSIAWGDMSNGGIQSIYGNYKPDLAAMNAKNYEAEQRIKRAFYEDLFLMLSNTNRSQITAREVAEKHEEKLLMLGPVLERFHDEMLKPLIERTFGILQDAGVLPEPPPDLQDREINIEFVSVLAQAQQMVAVNGIQEVARYVGELSQIWPEAKNKFDAMQSVDNFANAMGTDPKLTRSNDEANAITQAEQQQAQQAQAMAMADQAANTAKTASEVDPNALNDMMRNAGLQ